MSKVRGVGRYLQILRENFPSWHFTDRLQANNYELPTIFVNPFFNFLQTPVTIKRIAKKQIAVIHDLIPLKYPEHFPVGIKGRLNIFLNKLALKNYDIVVTDSEASKKDIIQLLGITEKKLKVIYPCLPRLFVNSELRIQNSELKNKKNLNSKFKSGLSILDSKFCLYVGDATWNKNLVTLAGAIKKINVTCVFVGKIFQRNEITDIYSHPWQQELKKFIEETKNDKRFIFAGYVKDEALIQLYQHARCNILVSRDEGFGFSYLEAASQGCPSVLSDIQVFRETSSSKGALFASPEKPDDIANAIGEFYFNEDKRNTLGVETERQVRSYSYSKFTEDWSKGVK
jgi:glycosyltransferase involved in cell wall biosynthesis